MVINGNYRSVFGATLKLLANNVEAQRKIFGVIFDVLQQQGWIIVGNAGVTWGGILVRLTSYLNILDKLLAGADFGTVLYQLSQTPRSLNTWDVSATPMKLPVVISPRSVQLSPGGQAPFQVTVGQGYMPTGSGSLVFDFQATTGTLGPPTGPAQSCSPPATTGNCVEPAGHEYFSSMGQVLYTAPADAKVGASDTLTVTVKYYPTGGMPMTIGSDFATIMFMTPPPAQPGTMTVTGWGMTFKSVPGVSRLFAHPGAIGGAPLWTGPGSSGQSVLTTIGFGNIPQQMNATFGTAGLDQFDVGAGGIGIGGGSINCSFHGGGGSVTVGPLINGELATGTFSFTAATFACDADGIHALNGGITYTPPCACGLKTQVTGTFSIPWGS
jgi:hypothetical protein